MKEEALARPALREAWRCGLRLRCPHCGRGRLFDGWFRMRRECPQCGLAYFRESGYYLGAMMINYALTAVIVLGAYLVQLRAPEWLHVSTEKKIALWMCFAVVVSLALMRHCYSLWLAMDYWLEPWEAPLPRGALSGSSHVQDKHLP